MASTFQISGIHSKHQANMAASLAHRLEIARASNNSQLLELLQREQQQLELTPRDQPRHPWQHQLRQWGQNLIAAIAHSSELQVWQTVDKSGTTCWHAYNPRTGHEVSTASETEMRIWIETNYWED